MELQLKHLLISFARFAMQTCPPISDPYNLHQCGHLYQLSIQPRATFLRCRPFFFGPMASHFQPNLLNHSKTSLLL